MTPLWSREIRITPRWLFAAGLGVLALWYGVLVSHGVFDPRHNREVLWHLYAGMWHRLAHGRFDLNPADAGGEAFVRDGRTYSYYGIFPAFLRGLAGLVRKTDWPGMPLVSDWLAALTCVAGFFWVGLRRVAQVPAAGERPAAWPLVLCLLTIALASPIVPALSASPVYNEAALWGCAWGCIFNAALVLFATSPIGSPAADQAVLVMSCAAPLSLLSRAPPGIIALLEFGAVLLWIATHDRPWTAARRRLLLVATLTCGALCLGTAIVNFARWGNPFEFRPMSLYEAYAHTERGWRTAEAGTFRLDRVPTSALYYFVPGTNDLLNHWPFLQLGFRPFPLGAPPYYDYIEKGVPLGLSSPALLLFAAAGLAGAPWWRPRTKRDFAALVLLGAGALATAMLLTFDTLAPRFLLDLTPALCGLGLLGVLRETPAWRRGWLVLAIPLVAWSIFATHIVMVLLKLYGTGAPSLLHDWLLRLFALPPDTHPWH